MAIFLTNHHNPEWRPVPPQVVVCSDVMELSLMESPWMRFLACLLRRTDKLSVDKNLFFEVLLQLIAASRRRCQVALKFR